MKCSQPSRGARRGRLHFNSDVRQSYSGVRQTLFVSDTAHVSSTCRHICRLRLTTATTSVRPPYQKRRNYIFNPLAACARAGKPGPLPAIEPRGMPPRRISAVHAGFLAAEMPECTRAWAYAHIAKSRAGCTSIHHGHGRKSTRASSGRTPPVTRQGPRARAARFPRAAVAAEGSLKSWRPR